jgi:hypothetical protein
MRAVTLVLLLLSSLQEVERRPNVLIILTDDQGYGDLGCQGNPKILTPHLDALSKESFQFERFKAPGAKSKVVYTGGAGPVEVGVAADATSVTLPAVSHAAGDGAISATIATAKPYGPDYVELRRVP